MDLYLISIKIIRTIVLFFPLLSICSCNQQNTGNNSDTFPHRLIEAKGYIIPEDSIVSPRIIPVDEKKLKKVVAGKPIVIPVNNNLNLAGKPKIIPAGKPKINTPGTDTFLLPEKISVVEKPIVAVMPVTFIPKDMSYKTPDPASFSYFGKLHGLIGGIVTCLLQDKFGNIWFCTTSGITRYDGKYFTNFTTSEGLVDNDVRSVMQDKQGNIWFGTLGNGISKYDGYSFTNFTVKDGLCNGNVISIIQDISGNIWFGTWGGGVTEYDGSSFINYTKKQGLVDNFVQCILEDKNGNIWFGTERGVSRFDGHSFTNFTQEEGLSNYNIQTINKDKLGNIWFGTIGGGVSIFNGRSFTNFTQKEGLIDNDINSILEDREGNFWFGTHFGISRYDGKTFTNFTEKQGLVNDNIYCCLQDRSGNIWFGTAGGGVAKYNPNSFTHFTVSEGLRKDHINHIHENKLGDLWIGEWRGGVAKYDGRSFKFFTTQQGLPYDDVRCIYEDKSGNLWLATFKGVVKYDGHSFTYFTEKDGLIFDDVNCITQDKKGNFWFGTEKGASKYDGHSFTNYSLREGLTSRTVYCIKEDKSGNLWFGASEGAFKYDGKSFTTFTAKSGFPGWAVCSIMEDQSGNFWFGTAGGGLWKYDGKVVTLFTQKEGLLHDFVSSLLQDKSGNIWIGNRYGLSKLTPEKSVLLSERIKSNIIYDNDVFFKNYGYEDNFLGIGCSYDAIIQTMDRHIWVGTNGGLTTFDPTHEVRDTIPPSVQLTAIKLFNENIDWLKLQRKQDTSYLFGNGIRFNNFHFDSLSRWYNLPQHLSLPYNNNYLSFDFIGITMNQPQNVKYQFQLEGLDKKWNTLTTQANATYGNLPPGTYTFKVKAMNSEGFWSKEYDYTFAIRSPWWQTWWFRVLVVLIISGLIFLITRFIYLSKLRKQKAIIEKQLAIQYERHRIASDLHDEIGSTLSSINIYAGMVNKNPENEFYIESISRNVNEVVNKLDDLVWSIRSVHDSLGAIAERLTAYADPAAKTKGMNFQLQLDQQLQDLKLSVDIKHHLYMITKELINNAIKHADCKNIKVTFKKQNGHLVINVNDDGKGFNTESAKQERNGLRNIGERVKEMKGKLKMESEINKGTMVIIEIPL